MNYWIDIEDAAGERQGPGPITSASYWTSTPCLDQAGTFEFSMPAADARAALIQPKRIARCYARVAENVTEIGAGIIEERRLQVDAQGRMMLVVSGGDLLQELANRSVGFLTLTDGTGGGSSTALAQIGTIMAESGWSFDTANGYESTIGNVYAQFAGESILAALCKIAESKGEHFRLGSGRKVVWLRKDLAASGLRAIQGGDAKALESNPDACIILSLEETKDATEVISRVYPFGSGIGDARLTMASATRTAPSGYLLDKAANVLKRTATEAVYGRIERYISFKEISPVSNTDADVQAAANALFDAALAHMEVHKQPERFYTIQLTKVDRLLSPGETLRVVFRSIVDEYAAADIDQELVILEVGNRIDSSGIRTTEVQVATVDRPRETDEAVLASRMEEVRVLESYPQLNANAYYETFYDAIDGSNALSFPILLGREVVNVNEVRLYFKIEPLESTVKSVAGQSTTSSSGGGGTTTSQSGGGGSTTSAGGGGVSKSTDGGASLIWINTTTFETSPAGSHSHWVNEEYSYSGDGGWHNHSMDHGHNVNVSNHSHEFNVPEHSHSVSIPAHNHSVNIPSHTHTLTPNISTAYGIYRDSSANVPAIGEISITLGGTPVNAVPSEIGSGWYETDLTALVSNAATFRPLRIVNTVRISCVSGKRAHIAGKVRVRTVIQATAVL